MPTACWDLRSFTSSKVPRTAVDVLNERMMPFYEDHDVQIDHLPTDNGCDGDAGRRLFSEKGFNSSQKKEVAAENACPLASNRC